MLKDLFKKNKLEYLHIYTNKDQNIVKIMTLSQNIENLRYMLIETYDRINIALDILLEYPKKLQVYYLFYYFGQEYCG